MPDRRTALVTGGAKGIGRAIAFELARQGVATVIADIDLPAAEATAAEISSISPSSARLIDISSPADIAAAFAALDDTVGAIDILVNNAGVISNAPYSQVTPQEWDRVMAINVTGPIFASQEALLRMRPRGYGRIVTISSLAGRSGGVSVGAAYAASKSALIGLSRHLARQVAGDGITVNVVAPGTTATDIISAFTPEEMTAINAAIPVGRLGRPEEIAAAVAFLASEAAGFITGAVLDVNGGMYMG